MKKIFFYITIVCVFLIQSCSPITASNDLGNRLRSVERDLNGAVLGPIVDPNQSSTSVVVAESANEQGSLVAIRTLDGERTQIISRLEFFEIVRDQADYWIISEDGTILVFFKTKNNF